MATDNLRFTPRTVPGRRAAVPARNGPKALAGFLVAATATSIAAIAQGPLGIGGTPAEGVLRVQAWYPSANHLALMLGRAWPFLVAGALSGRRWLWLPAGIVGLALVLTFSTGGWLGALAGALVVVAALGGRRLAFRVGIAAAGALLLTSSLAIAGVLPERLNPLRQTGGFRVDLWLSSLEMGWLVVRFWFSTREALTKTESPWLIAGAAGAMADVLVHGFIDNSYFLVDLAFVFWLCLALVADVRTDVRIDST